MRCFDTIVIGLGGMGSAALYHLARRGMRVLGIEQFGIAHDRGSSHGRTRIIRKAYFEHPDYVPLVERAYALWADLEAEANLKLIHRTGLLLFGPPEGEVITGVKRAATVHRLDIKPLTLNEVHRRFPCFQPDEQMEVLYENEAGYLLVEECVRAHVNQARLLGASVALNETVLHWKPVKNGMEITTNRSQYQTEHLVMCGGAWTNRLLADSPLPLRIHRMVMTWFDVEIDCYQQQNGCPVFCFDTAEGFFYGFPVINDEGMKIARHTGGEIIDNPDHIDRKLHEADTVDTRRFIQHHLAGVIPTATKHSVCMYTMTPDCHFIIDRWPQYPGVVVAAGFSGHGFKFAPIVGSILADLAITGRTDEPVAFLRSSRFSPPTA